jgi:hypothetical protein
MKKAETEAMLQKLADLIQSVPLGVYDEINGTGSQSSYRPKDSKKKDSTKKTGSLSTAGTGTEEGMEDMLSLLLWKNFQGKKSSSDYYDIDHESALKLLVLEYRKQLVEAVEFMKARNETVPPKIEEAIRHLDAQLGLQHWVGK